MPRRVAAAAVAAVLIALVGCDLAVGAVRSWWDRHSFTGCVVSSLLVVGVTALIFDEVVARRQRRERAELVAVQGLIVYGQARRTYNAVVASATGSPGDSGAPDELRSLANMLLIASPALFDDPVARPYLEQLQRLAGSMLRAVTSSIGPSPGSVALTSLGAEMSRLQASVEPLMLRIPSEDVAPFTNAPDWVAPEAKGRSPR